MKKPTSNPTPPKKSLTFSEEMQAQMEKSMHQINKLTLESNKKIREFRSRSHLMTTDIQDLATIMSTKLTLLEEKYKVIYALIEDIYQKLETFNTLQAR